MTAARPGAGEAGSLAWGGCVAGEPVRRIAGEQAALRRVATLVARGAPPEEVFAAVAAEAGHVVPGADFTLVSRYDSGRAVEVVGGWSRAGHHRLVGLRTSLGGRNASTLVFERNEPARADYLADDASALTAVVREMGMRSSVGAPISVEGRLWGVMIVTSTQEPLPAGTEARLAGFTELVATAITNAETRAEVERLVEEQAALRRVATLVAEGRAPTAVFDAVAAEMERLLDADGVTLGRYEPGDEVTVVAHRRGPYAQRMAPGTRISHAGENVTTIVRRTERPARIDYAETVPGVIADMTRGRGIRAAIGAPIVVEGRLWGVISAAWSGGKSPPADMEERMAQFAQLLGTA
ncbi:MAG TPA: GAF domain-containing protein, partial [Streptosporangiaceae bacterium]|nr:GAF domain-containing protein [Streptosporangiaceae bacterium]